MLPWHVPDGRVSGSPAVLNQFVPATFVSGFLFVVRGGDCATGDLIGECIDLSAEIKKRKAV